MKSVFISVIIPTYNSWRTLNACLSSVQKQTCLPAEIIVIDNASTDSTHQNVLKYYPKVKIISQTLNTGVTGGRNAGINNMNPKSDYAFFFDHDMIAHPQLLEQLLRVATSRSNIGIVTPKIYYLSQPNKIWAAGTGINLWTGQVLFRGGEDQGQYELVQEVQVAPAAMFISRHVLTAITKFDERYFATYEDTDFCFRAKKAGFSTYYSPKAIAYHDLSIDPHSEADRLLSRSYYVGRNRILFMKDFAKLFPLFLLCLPIYALYYLKMSLKYHRLNDWFIYLRGNLAGLL